MPRRSLTSRTDGCGCGSAGRQHLSGLDRHGAAPPPGWRRFPGAGGLRRGIPASCPGHFRIFTGLEAESRTAEAVPEKELPPPDPRSPRSSGRRWTGSIPGRTPPSSPPSLPSPILQKRWARWRSPGSPHARPTFINRGSLRRKRAAPCTPICSSAAIRRRHGTPMPSWSA